MNHFLFCLVPVEEWRIAEKDGEYRPSQLEQEGAIMLLTASQVQAVKEALYPNHSDLMLLVISEEKLKSPLRWELAGKNRLMDKINLSGMRFPYLYGPLNVDAVFRTIDLSSTDLKEALKILGKPRLEVADMLSLASLIAGILAILTGVGSLTYGLPLSFGTNGNELFRYHFFVALFLLTLFFSALGGTLGIGGLVQDKKKGLGISGCILNALIFILFFTILCFSLVMGMAETAP